MSSDPGALAPLQLRPFRLLFAGRFIAYVGNAVALASIPFAVLDIGGSAGEVGLVLAARSLPMVAVMLLGGVIADRFPRHLVLVTSNLVSASSQGLVAVLLLTDNATIRDMMLLQAVGGTAAAVVYPAAAGLTPQTVPTPLLQQANALLRLGLNSAMIGGVAAGGALVATVGPGWGLALDAVTYVVAAVILSRLVLPGEPRAHSPAHVVADLREGWVEFRSRTWVWVVVVQFAFVNAALACGFTTLGPVIADDTIGRGAWGLVLAAQTAGMAAGGLLALRIRPVRPLLVGTVGALLEAPVLLALAWDPRIGTLMAFAFLGGLAVEVFTVFWDLSLQQHIPLDRLSRVASYDALGSFAFMPVGQMLAGPLSSWFGVTETVVIAAAVVLAATGAALTVRDVRALRRLDLEPTAGAVAPTAA